MPEHNQRNIYERLMQPVEEGPALPAGLPASNTKTVDVAFFREQGLLCPALCYATSLAVGFVVSIYRIAGAILAEDGEWYQVMRWDDGPGPGQAFWLWYLLHRPQFFPTPEQAAAVFVEERRKWLASQPI